MTIQERLKSLEWIGEQEGLNIISLHDVNDTNHFRLPYCQIWIEVSLLPIGDKKRMYGVWFRGFQQFWDKDLDKVKANAIKQLTKKWK